MSKVGIIVPTHILTEIAGFMRTIQHLKPMDFEVCAIAQPPVTYEFLEKMGVHTYAIVDPPKVKGLIEMVHWYDVGMRILKHCDYFLFIDHDHRFKPAKNDKPSSGTYYQECIDYMDANPDVGVFNTKFYFGGAAWKYEIKKNPVNGLLSINTGMFIRNVPEFKFNRRELSFVGTLVESLLGYKMIALGYNNAKRYYCPTTFTKSKRLYSGEPTYSKEVLLANIQGYIQEIYDDPDWDHESRKYPKGLGR